MEPDREDRTPAHAWLRVAWRQRSLAALFALPGRLSEALGLAH